MNLPLHPTSGRLPADELARLYDAHAAALFGFLLRLAGNEADVHDLLQELFVKLGARAEVLAGVQDERGFLLRMAHNLFLDLVRRKGTRSRYEEASAGEKPPVFLPADTADESQFRARLETALGELPEEQRTVVHLKLWEGMTFDAIADALGIPLNTAASRYRYGVDKLRARLRPLYDEIKAA